MKYLILELQTNTDGTIGTLITQKDTLNEAQSTYYMILASAAISELPVHAAVLMTNEGITLEFKSFTKEAENGSIDA